MYIPCKGKYNKACRQYDPGHKDCAYGCSTEIGQYDLPSADRSREDILIYVVFLISDNS